MTFMEDGQGMATADPIDQLVPAPGGRGRLALLVVGAFVVLGLAAVAPISGVARPNLELDDRFNGSALDGAGDYELVVDNRGWTTATIDHFELELTGVEITETTYLRLADNESASSANNPFVPVAAGEPTAGPVEIAPGDGIIIRLRFAYDCTRLGTIQHSTVDARGVTPVWSTVDLGTGMLPGPGAQLAGMLDFACTGPPPR